MTGKRLYWESLAWSAFSVLVYLLFNHFQPTIRLNGGQGWDGTQYFGMFSYFRHGKFSNYAGSGPLFPFNQRPLGPLIAACLSRHFSWTPVRSFKVLHICSISATSGLLYYIFCRYFGVGRFFSSLALLWFLFHALSYARLTTFYPYMVDPLATLSLALLLYVVVSDKYLFLPILTIFGCMVKEQFLAFLIVMFLYEVWSAVARRKLAKKKLILLAISIVLDIAANYYVRNHLFQAPGSSALTSALTLVWWGYQRCKHPLSFVRYVVSYFAAFGAFGLLLVFYLRRCLSQVMRQNSYQLIALFSLVFMGFGLLAGADMDKILWSGFPFLMPIMLLAIKGFTKTYVSILFLLTVPMMHLVSAIPEPSGTWPNNDASGLFSWMMEYANPGIVAMWAIYMVILWMLIGRLRFLNRNHSQ